MRAESPKRAFKNDLYGKFARLGKALASPKRLELLDLVCQGPRTVESAASETALSVANASQHLLALKAAGLLVSQKKGLHVIYEAASGEVAPFLVAFQRLAEIGRLTGAFFQDAPEPLGLRDLLAKLKKGEAVLLDVRPPAEFEAGHLPGAISVPLPLLKASLAKLPKRKEIVAYCRGPYCVFAHQAVALLRRHGFKAHRLEEGVAEWRARGLSVERSPKRA